MSKIDLEPERQIAILMRASELVLDNPNLGLCWYIRNAIKEKELQIYLQENGLVGLNNDCIPLFTRENAVKYANGIARIDIVGLYTPFWWPTGDTNSRLNFLSWMIRELQKEAKNG